MSNVDLHVTAEVTLRVQHLRGRFEPTGRADMPYLDDKLSYVVAIDSGEIALEMASLNALMTKTLGQGRSNVEKLRISTDDQESASAAGRSEERASRCHSTSRVRSKRLRTAAFGCTRQRCAASEFP